MTSNASNSRSRSWHRSAREKWIRTTVLDDASSPSSSLQKDDVRKGVVLSKVDGVSSNISSSRLWLEHCELEVHQGQEGVYTVLRVDFDTEYLGWCKVWGLTFHLERLKESIRRLLHILQLESSIEMENEALSKTKDILYEFLRSYYKEVLEKQKHGLDMSNAEYCERENGSLMIAFLWAPVFIQNNNKFSIKVEGHASEISIKQNPDSIDAVLAISNGENHSDSLPSRYDREPMAKLSGWCSRRRPLEEMFKPSSIGEVFLCRKLRKNIPVEEDDTDIQVLEGLTSNVCVVMDDGTIRTAGYDVLPGYARRLVFKAATELGLSIDKKAPLLSEMEAGRWKEVFITSSIRIIVPVKRLFMKSSESNLDKKWTSSNVGATQSGKLLQAILSMDQDILEIEKM